MAIKNELLAIVQHIEQERGVRREIVVTAIEQALTQAAKKNRAVSDDLRIEIDRRNFTLHVYDTVICSDTQRGPGFISVERARRYKSDAVSGDLIEIEMPPPRLGRIIAQNTRQLILQKIREAEKTNTFSLYRDKQGDIITGQVSELDKQDILLTVGRTTMIMPKKEKIPNEMLEIGDTVKAIILRVDLESKGPTVVVSRASPKFLEALMRLEVSEIQEGIVEVLGVARDPGYRAKIAVRSLNPNVDPVGACVGQKGGRIRAIVSELGGEKIDIVKWNEDVLEFVKEALQPARLDKLDVIDDNTVAVEVSPEEYDKALGRRGQNVKLASRLVGWNIEVNKSLKTAKFEDRKAEAIKRLAEMLTLSNKVATQIVNAGFLDYEGIIDEDEPTFIAMTGLDEVTAKGIYAAAKTVAAIMGQKAVEQARMVSADEEQPEAFGEDESE